MSLHSLQIKQYLMSLRQGPNLQVETPITIAATVIASNIPEITSPEVKTASEAKLPALSTIAHKEAVEPTASGVEPKLESTVEHKNASWFPSPIALTADMASFISEKLTSVHTKYIEPITKAQVDSFIVSNIGFTTYYGLVAAAKLEGASTFAVRAEVSMGFKLFNAVANPLLAQFVESFTEVHANNGKYLYYSATCALYGTNCEETAKLNNPFKITDFDEKANLLQDFTQFDLKRYTNEASTNLDAISIKNLLSSGAISATAAQVVDTFYEGTGLKPYVQSKFMKEWVTYYFKEWVKGEIRTEANTFKTKVQDVLGLNDGATNTAQPTTKPLKMSDIIIPADNDVVGASGPAPVVPMMDTTTLQVPVMAVTPEII